MPRHLAIKSAGIVTVGFSVKVFTGLQVGSGGQDGESALAKRGTITKSATTRRGRKIDKGCLVRFDIADKFYADCVLGQEAGYFFRPLDYSNCFRSTPQLRDA